MYNRIACAKCVALWLLPHMCLFVCLLLSLCFCSKPGPGDFARLTNVQQKLSFAATTEWWRNKKPREPMTTMNRIGIHIVIRCHHPQLVHPLIALHSFIFFFIALVCLHAFAIIHWSSCISTNTRRPLANCDCYLLCEAMVAEPWKTSCCEKHMDFSLWHFERFARFARFAQFVIVFFRFNFFFSHTILFSFFFFCCSFSCTVRLKHSYIAIFEYVGDTHAIHCPHITCSEAN